MNQKNISKLNRFGKIGKNMMTFFIIITSLLTLLCGVCAVAVEIVPHDAVEVSVTSHADFTIRETVFPSVWRMIASNVSYETDKNPSEIIEDSKEMVPEEDTEIHGELKFLTQSYSSATIQADGKNKVIHAESSPEIYNSSDLGIIFVIATLFLISLVVSFVMIRKLFSSLSNCESPFNLYFTSYLKKFGYSLLPLFVLASVGETMAIHFLSAGNEKGVFIQWGLLIAFIITIFLVKVFQYGVLLQKESDETL